MLLYQLGHVHYVVEGGPAGSGVVLGLRLEELNITHDAVVEAAVVVLVVSVGVRPGKMVLR